MVFCMKKNSRPSWFDAKTHEKCHKFKMIENIQYSTERNLLSEWIKIFPIKDGQEKTIKQFQETFHSVFWELYLNNIFHNSGYHVDEKIVSPDFYITYNNQKIGIEAVIANISQTGKKEEDRTIDDVYGDNNINTIINESAIRLFNGFTTKNKKYLDSYSRKEFVKNNPFVLAMGDYGQINYGQSAQLSMLALLYQAFYDPDNNFSCNEPITLNDSWGREYKQITSIQKNNGSLLNIGLFRDNACSHISAIIYSCTTSLGKLTSLCENHTPLPKFTAIEITTPTGIIYKSRYSNEPQIENIYDGLFVFHNPLAKNPVNSDFMKSDGVVHFYFDTESKKITIESTKSEILTRRYVCMASTESELLGEKFATIMSFRKNTY